MKPRRFERARHEGVFLPAVVIDRNARISATGLKRVGRVVLVLQARDGDTHINVLPDRGYWHLLNRRNYLIQSGTLVVEVIPADRAQVPVPAIGTHVRVTGAYVTDLEHGWREIHPAWQIVPAP